MTFPPRLLVFILLAAGCAAPVWPARAQALADRPAAPVLARAITLAELGFADGIQFTGMSGRRDLFFPVPRNGAARGMVLRLAYDSGSAFESRRSLQVAAGERVIFAGALPQGSDKGVVDIPIDSSLIDGPFLRLSLRYAGVVTENRCIDQRLNGDFLTILPASNLTMAVTRDALADVRSVAALMPHDVTVLLPDRALSEAEAASVLKLAAVLGADRRDVDFAGIGEFVAALRGAAPQGWARGLVVLGGADDVRPLRGETPQAAEDGQLSTLMLPTGPALWVGGERAAAFLASEWRGLAAAPKVAPAADAKARPQDRLTFDRLNATLATQDVLGRATFDASFALADLPAGMKPSRVDLDLAIAEDAGGESASVAAFLNGRLLGSTLSDGAVPTHFSAAIPDGLVGLDNNLQIVVQRPPRGSDCNALPVGSPAQLLPSSAIELTAAKDAPRDFFDLVPRFKTGVTVTLPSGDPLTLGSLLPLVAPLAAGLIAPDAPVAVRYGAPILDGNFIAVADALPGGAETPVRFDKGRMVLTDRAGKPLFDLDAQARMASAQLVAEDKGAGLWIKPPPESVTPDIRPLRLDRGNVAFIDSDGIVLAFSTLRDQLVQVTYPDRISWLGLAQQYRPWIVGAFWLAVTLGFIALIRRMARRRKGN